jgi:hypothetical protein
MTNRQDILDRFKLLVATTIVETVDIATIRA